MNYTYLVGWSKYNRWYYGRRTSKDSNPKDLWVTYFTSSDYVKHFRKECGDPDIIQVRKTFETREDCAKWETKVHRRLNVALNDKWLNQRNGDEDFDSTNKSTYFDKLGNKIYTTITNPKVLSGEYKSMFAGMVNTKDSSGKLHYVKADDPRLISGELSFFLKNTVAVIKNGKKCRVSKEEYDTSDYDGHTKGLTACINPEGNIEAISKYDSRWLSGEVKHYMADKLFYKHKDTGKMIRVYLDDPILQTGDWIIHNYMKNPATVLKNRTTKYKEIIVRLGLKDADELDQWCLSHIDRNKSISENARVLNLPWNMVKNCMKSL